jgi:multicomponent Na+:H+ antiporter subunit A
VERDLKRILAYSTVATLGLLVLMLGIGTPAAASAALAFLLAHALYKGALFLVAGAVEHGTGTRDVERLGGLGRAMPFTAMAGVAAGLSMAGLPPLLGFASKELVYAAALEAGPWAVLAAWASVLAGGSLACVALLAGVRPFLGARLATPVGPHEPRLALWGPPLVLAAAGLLLGLAPQSASAVVGAAARAVLPGGGAVELAPWHAPGWPMALGVAGLLLGGAAWHWRLGLRRLDAAAGGGASWGPSRGYEPALGGLLRGAAIQTRSLQSGSLRRYLHVILLAALAITAAALLAPGGWPDPLIRPEVRLHEAGLAALVVASAVVAVRSRSRLRAIAAMGVVGYGIALVFLFYGAPDLAMTQFVVETLTVVVLVSAFHRLPRYAALSTRAARLVDLAISGAFGALMAGLVLAASSVDLAEKISPYFVENGVEKAHGRNIVNVILVDFRALDTLGEITVIAIAGFGVLALLGLRGGTEGRP